MEDKRTVKHHGPRGLLARDLATLERASRAYLKAHAARLRVEAQITRTQQSGAR